MATVSPVIDRTIAKIPRVIWETVKNDDTATALPISEQWGLAASVQASGTFGGATVVMQHSNDGTNWFTAKDLQGDDISLTADGFKSLRMIFFSPRTSFAYLKPLIPVAASTSATTSFLLLCS